MKTDFFFASSFFQNGNESNYSIKFILFCWIWWAKIETNFSLRKFERLFHLLRVKCWTKKQKIYLNNPFRYHKICITNNSFELRFQLHLIVSCVCIKKKFTNFRWWLWHEVLSNKNTWQNCLLLWIEIWNETCQLYFFFGNRSGKLRYNGCFELCVSKITFTHNWCR